MSDPPSPPRPSSPPTLLKMPKEILTSIIGDTTALAIQSLRKTSKSLRTFIDEKPINLNLPPEAIYFVVFENQIDLTIMYTDEDRPKEHGIEEFQMSTTYKQTDEGCVYYNSADVDLSMGKLLRGEDSFEIAYNDFESFLRGHAGVLEECSVEFQPIQSEIKRQKSADLQQKLIAYLQSRSELFQVEELSITAPTGTEILSLLRCFCPLAVERLIFSDGRISSMDHLLFDARGAHRQLDVSNLVLTEHWKKAFSIEIHRCLVQSPIHFFATPMSIFMLDTLKLEHLCMMRDSFKLFPFDRQCSIKFNNFENEETASVEFGRYSNDGRTTCWFFLFPGTNNVMRFEKRFTGQREIKIENVVIPPSDLARIPFNILQV
ncbi:hypothetical protein GCK72_013254 [Caenorhabditis remanei]|uniref:DUF38 domain-containing protein n=1 Tax=Caenorhabditis remanei TaxID=31234 RepID=A0A6A5GND3_CAERE|nr:hypothetical protein GCK72_013254 [Caenorhabditis remanei]KAF1756800.1 hypothetical protein GCK72_013254 [Caenorhabditis remanei]